MGADLFIAGDWGTSNLRLYLCKYHAGGNSRILETRGGPGVSQVQGKFEETLFSLVDDWIAQHGALPVIISGMAGSTIGWREAPYLPCPMDIHQLAQGCLNFEARGLTISIIAGLRATNPLGAPDVMRGEELQLLGWMRSDPSQDNTARLFALPGTHNKWTLLKNGRIETFVTALTGELFALLKNHSVLIADRRPEHFSERVFLQGVKAIEDAGPAQLLNTFFTTRSRQVLGDLSPNESLWYLSGLIVGADCIGALALFRKSLPDIASVTLIGEPALSNRYQLALARLGVPFHSSDAAEIAIAGYAAIYQTLYQKDTA